ncbi:MAG: hypothetical protein L0Y56_15945, partial [Nitrospira sp.]|nr:hypothetical protein [Nitrospira sp.]
MADTEDTLVPLFLGGKSHGEQPLRLLNSMLMAGGDSVAALESREGIRAAQDDLNTTKPLFVRQDPTPNQTVLVNPGQAIIRSDTAGQGSYLATLETGATIDITAADGTNPRKDLIILEVV